MQILVSHDAFLDGKVSIANSERDFYILADYHLIVIE